MGQVESNVISFNAWKEKALKKKQASSWSADVSDNSIHVHHQPSGLSFYFMREGNTAVLSDEIVNEDSIKDPAILGDYLNEATEIAEQISEEEWLL